MTQDRKKVLVVKFCQSIIIIKQIWNVKNLCKDAMMLISDFMFHFLLCKEYEAFLSQVFFQISNIARTPTRLFSKTLVI